MKNCVLGISSFGHDTSACLVEVNTSKTIFASAQERFSNIKFDDTVPFYTISECINFAKKYNYNIIKTHPIAYNGFRSKKNSKKKTVNILFAGTYKVFLSRPYIYQDSFEFYQMIKKLILVFRNLKNVNLVLNIRTNDEIDNFFLKRLVQKDLNINFFFNANIEKLMQESDLLITNFSTLIDEYSYLNKPVIILRDFLRYESYKDLYLGEIKNELLNPIYYLTYEELHSEIIDILEKIKKDVKVNKPRHIWSIEEAFDNQTLLKIINE